MSKHAPTTIIIQRVVPHYRAPLFQKLYEDHGIVVVCAKNPPAGTGLNIGEHTPPWMHLFDFEFPDPNDPYRACVPINDILETLQPTTVISEFTMKIDSVRKLIVARKLGRIEKLLFWSHGWNMGRGFTGLKNKISQYGRLLPYAFADGHITYSQEGAEFINRFLPAMPTFVAKNTQEFEVDENKLSHSIENSGCDGRPFNIIASGRLTPEKNFPLLVQLFKKVLATTPNARLTIIGDGPDRPIIEKEAGALLGEKIFLPGAVYDANTLSDFFLKADVAAYAGAVGLAVNHALAFGLPFVAFERGTATPPYHHPEIAYIIPGETGALAPNQDFDAFVSQLTNLAQDRTLLATMRQSARDYFVKELSIEQYALGVSQALE